MDKFKQIWNNPRYNALIRLGLWFIFFTLVIVFIRLSPKEEVPKKEEKVQITYNDIKKEFANSSVMLTMILIMLVVLLKMAYLMVLYKMMELLIKSTMME